MDSESIVSDELPAMSANARAAVATPLAIDPNNWAALIPTSVPIDDRNAATSRDSDCNDDAARRVPAANPDVSAVNIADMRDMPAMDHLRASNWALICGIFLSSSIISISV